MNRILTLDLLRSIAIFLILILHSWSMLNLDNEQYGVICYCYRALVNTGVPIFFMISGALLLNAKIIPISHFLKKRLWRVLIPFLLWAIVIYAISAFMGKYSDIVSISSAFQQFVPYLLENRINPSHWFVHVIVILYLITPILQRAFSISNKRVIEYCLLLWGLFLLFLQFYPELYVIQTVLSSLINYIGLFIAGYYIVKYTTNKRQNRIIGFVGFFSFYTTNVILEWQGISINICNYMEVLCLFLGLYSLSFKTSHFSDFTTRLSRYSYTIYLIHIPIIGALCKIHSLFIIPSSILPILVAFITLTICFTFCLCIEKCRFINSKWIGI